MGSALIAPLVGGVVSSVLGGSSSSGTAQAASAADPFASQRGQYQDMLRMMMTGQGSATSATPSAGATTAPASTTPWAPSDSFLAPGTLGGTTAATTTPQATSASTGGTGFTPQDPSYQWRFQQGLDAANAGAAASGMLNSGNRLLALQTYGQGQASTEYANQFSRLSQLAGANVGSPAAAGQIIQQGNAANQQAASAVGNTVGKAVAGWGNTLASTNTSGTGIYNTDFGGGTVQNVTDTSVPAW